jgi:YkoY family integral membrane protein
LALHEVQERPEFPRSGWVSDDWRRAFGTYLRAVDFHYADLVTIGLLVLLEGLLSADNALVLAVLVLGLPKDEQRKALRYGILGAFAFRFLATVFAAYMIGLAWVKLLGALYLLYLPLKHFSGGDAEARRTPKQAKAWLGLTAFWATVVKVELTDIVFAIDSILVAVAMSNKLWVIVTGGLLGILAMRMLIGQLLVVVQRYPPLVDGAFIIIAWVGIKLLVEYLHQIHVIGFEIPKWLSLGLIVVIFGIAFLYARRQGPVAVAGHDDETASLLQDAVDSPPPAGPRANVPVERGEHQSPRG